MKKATVAILVGLGLMLASTSTLSAGCGGCPKIHFGCKKHKVVKKHHVRKHHAKKKCGLHLPKCFHFSCNKK